MTAPGHVYAAEQRVAKPTPARAAAGNYRKGHVVVGGLEITIETPQGSLREGIGKDGTPWRCTMPAPYGYIKNTVACDGDHLDCYLGPHAHMAEELPVWCIDQIDADTKDYDEPKVFIGFLDKHIARNTYQAAFSDGRGLERVGAAGVMPWVVFKQWLAAEGYKKPLFYQKQASVPAKYAAMVPSCSCDKCFGVTMSKSADAPSPRTMGFLSGLMAKALGSMNADERKVFIADAAATASSELSKAGEYAINMGAGENTIPVIEDQWSGPPDDGLTFHRAGGPGTEAPSGTVTIGKPQEASGGGAAKMEREYSRFARQSGVEEATNRLGRELSKAKAAIKSLVAFGEAMSHRMTALESTSLGTTTPAPVAKSEVNAEIAKAVAQMLPDMVRQTAAAVGSALIKASESDKEDESGEEDEEEDDDSEASEAESGSGTEIEIVNEMEEEDESESDDDEGRKKKAAAKSRLIAKSLFKLALRSIRKAKKMGDEKKEPEMMAETKKARTRIAKARLHLEIAKAVRGAKPGPSTIGLEKALAKAAKELRPQTVMQTQWPASKHDEIGKGTPAVSDTKSLSEQVEIIRKAVEGQGMLTASMNDMINSIARQPMPGSDNLPPVFALAKARPEQMDSIEQDINALAASNAISMDEADRAMSVISYAKRRMPQADAMIPSLPVVLQQKIKDRIAA